MGVPADDRRQIGYHCESSAFRIVGGRVGVGDGGDLPPSLLRHTSSKLNQLIEGWKVGNNLPEGSRTRTHAILRPPTSA